MTARPETLEAALAELDRVSADRDRLLQKLDDEPDSKKLIRDLADLIRSHYNAASTSGQRALVLNLGQLLRQSGALVDALTTELQHYVSAEFAARYERDELQERIAELSDEIADLRTRECARSVIL
ncbi:Uncharacterised protein [Mycobacteroides abscessus subsp. bolletii]|uniref:hypothetical protein n=1 Tax=Mycobacteroides abscessus TaxID=36809 RepID=UPI0009A5AE10|nr:hypothetical protein [Mycobacteroides abscessus]SKS51103.1 Uncharacterised protein [Mycobacteroides abscessus subsp. bolletii]SKY55425.1 Uncharacterised protein [Mycobacteroides abscessus subsp. bolletii]SLE09541.1 Uncharacterised protein [Mycobacteroides abscessus subsp. bolletii]